MSIRFEGPKLEGPENYQLWANKAQAFLTIIECNGVIFYDYSEPYRPFIPVIQPELNGIYPETLGLNALGVESFNINASSGVSTYAGTLQRGITQHTDPSYSVLQRLAGLEEQDNNQRNIKNNKALSCLKLIVSQGPLV